MATDLLTEAVVVEGVTLRGITWETYLDLRDNHENRRIRMTYLDGTLTLMSPQYPHEKVGQLLNLLVRAVVKALGLELKGTGSTTLRRGETRRGAGKEPDTSFYIGANELRMRTMTTLDLTVDPPPDLAIEVDHKADSSSAMSIYARLGIPEVWRYAPADDVALRIYRLEGEGYEEEDRSLLLPVLTPALILEALRTLDEARMGEIAWAVYLDESAQRIAAGDRDCRSGGADWGSLGRTALVRRRGAAANETEPQEGRDVPLQWLSASALQKYPFGHDRRAGIANPSL